MCSSRGDARRRASTAEISTAGTTRTPRRSPGVDRLGDAADGVVVGQREQLHAGLGGAGDDLGGGERAVGVGGVRLQVEAGGHRAERMRSSQRLACRSEAGVAVLEGVVDGPGPGRDAAPERLAQAPHGGVVAARLLIQQAVALGVGGAQRGAGGVGLGGPRAGVEPQHLEVGEGGAELLGGTSPGGSSSRRTGSTSLVSQCSSACTRSSTQMS